jgi:hypothetical protein
MEKMVINFSGKTPQKTDYSGIMEAVGQAVDEKREQILTAKKNNQPVTVILPDHGVMAVALTQAVRGLLGRTPYVQSTGTDEVDTESIREAFQESLGA